MIFGRFPSFPLETSLNWPAILSLLLPSCQTEKTNNWEVMGSLSQNQSTLVWPALLSHGLHSHPINIKICTGLFTEILQPIKKFSFHLYFAESLLQYFLVFSLQT